MNRDFYIYAELEKLRRETRKSGEPIALELPMHLPYWPEPEEVEDDQDADEKRGVVIIDMNDYSEMDV